MITLKRASTQAIRYACLNFHYAHVVPCAIYSYNVYNADGEWCGVILFGNGAMNINTPFGMENGEVYELVRVALNGKQPCTSECVAAAVRQLHKDAPQIKLLVSYADMDQDHVGTIYQATNWIYLGETAVSGRAGFVVKGKKIHTKTVYSNGWVGSAEWLRQHVDQKAYEIKSKGKRKYIYVYDKKIRKEWQKKALPYPKKPCVSSSTAEQPALLQEDGSSTPTLTLQQ